LLFSSYSEVDVETDVHEITEIPTELDASLQETSLEQQAAAAIETDNGSLLGATHNTSVTLRGAKCEGQLLSQQHIQSLLQESSNANGSISLEAKKK
jgi:hypothetical protein